MSEKYFEYFFIQNRIFYNQSLQHWILFFCNRL